LIISLGHVAQHYHDIGKIEDFKRDIEIILLFIDDPAYRGDIDTIPGLVAQRKKIPFCRRLADVLKVSRVAMRLFASLAPGVPVVYQPRPSLGRPFSYLFLLTKTEDGSGVSVCGGGEKAGRSSGLSRIFFMQNFETGKDLVLKIARLKTLAVSPKILEQATQCTSHEGEVLEEVHRKIKELRGASYNVVGIQEPHHSIVRMGTDGSKVVPMPGGQVGWLMRSYGRGDLTAVDLSLEQRIFMMSDTTQALFDLHAIGYVQGDIKPGNIFIGHTGKCVLADWGGKGSLEAMKQKLLERQKPPKDDSLKLISLLGAFTVDYNHTHDLHRILSLLKIAPRVVEEELADLAEELVLINKSRDVFGWCKSMDIYLKHYEHYIILPPEQKDLIALGLNRDWRRRPTAEQLYKVFGVKKDG
jgi:hypothetical protein